jgi:hypothetical protein
MRQWQGALAPLARLNRFGRARSFRLRIRGYRDKNITGTNVELRDEEGR